MSGWEIIDDLRKIRVVPLRRDTFEELNKNFIIPREILNMFRYAKHYSMGMAELKNRLDQGLLVAREPALESLELERLSLHEYDHFTQKLKLGRIPEVIE